MTVSVLAARWPGIGIGSDRRAGVGGSVADGGRGAVEARVGGLVEQEAGDVGAGEAAPILSWPRKPARTLPVRSPSLGWVKRAIVQSRELPLTSSDISSSSR